MWIEDAWTKESFELDMTEKSMANKCFKGSSLLLILHIKTSLLLFTGLVPILLQETYEGKQNTFKKQL